MISCDDKENKRRAVLSILLVCLVSVLCSCGSMSEEEKLQKMAAEDPLITSSRETSAHMKESIEKAKQYIPDAKGLERFYAVSDQKGHAYERSEE